MSQNNLVVSPSKILMKDVLAKLPSTTSITKQPDSKPLKHVESNSSSKLAKPKRKRLSSSSSCHSSPDIRKKVLVKSVERKIADVKSSKNESVIELDETIDEITNEKNHEAESVSLDEQAEKFEVFPRVDVDPSNIHEEVVDVDSDPLNIHDEVIDLVDMSINEALKKEEAEKESGDKSEEKLVKTNEVTWIKVRRLKRKLHFYSIKASAEDEAFRLIKRSDENNLVPSCLNGRKPLAIVPGIDYGLDEEVVGEVLDDKADEEELNMIRKENYLLDSFCCDTGYLSDEELNETPSSNKTVSKVKQIRRANNIKDKRKFEKLGEPQILGPFWWNGKGGCKKELKKWQPFVFPTTPIDTGFSQLTPVNYQNLEEVEVNKSDQVNEVNPHKSDQLFKEPQMIASTSYNDKYCIKYLVKFLVQKRMEEVNKEVNNSTSGTTGISSVDSVNSSAPLIRKPAVTVTQEHLKCIVMNYNNEVCKENIDLVDKYVAKYFHKYTYCSK